MGLSNGELSAADVAAVVDGGGRGGLGWGDGSFWIIILFIFAMMSGGWGNGWGSPSSVNVGADVQRGFDQSAVMNGIMGINASLANGFAASEVSQCNQTANLTGQISALALNQATNACNTNANIADLKYTVATENCADRAAVSEALQNVLTTLNGGIQSIKDQMCQDKIDSKNEEIANLRTQINLANLAASQNAQTAAIIANNDAQTTALEQYLAPVPRPAYIVSSPYCCNQGYSYGCGCGAA